MAKVLSLVNSVSSTSIPVEIANATHELTDSHVTVGSLMQNETTKLDPDVEDLNVSIKFFGGESNFDLSTYSRLRDFIQSNNFQIIHTHHNFSGSVSRIIGNCQETKIVNTEHNDHRHFSTLQRLSNTATFMLSDVNVYNSKSTKQSLNPIAKRCSKRDEVIYNGVDIDRIEQAKDCSLPMDLPDGVLVTNIGVMTPQKNQQLLLKAARELKTNLESDNLNFIIGGSGPLHTELKQQAARLQVEDIVHFTGYLPKRDHVYKLMHESDLFVTPSVYEGFCVAAVEAMACELPVIASDIDVFKEVIGNQGIFIPHGDYTKLADRIAEVVENIHSAKIEQKREVLANRAADNFPLKKTAKEYHRVYNEIMGSSVNT